MLCWLLVFYITYVKFGKITLPIWEEPNAVEDQAEAFDDIDATDAQCFD